MQKLYFTFSWGNWSFILCIMVQYSGKLLAKTGSQYWVSGIGLPGYTNQFNGGYILYII